MQRLACHSADCSGHDQSMLPDCKIVPGRCTREASELRCQEPDLTMVTMDVDLC